MDNPYKAPTTPLKEPPAQPRSPILAVLAGMALGAKTALSSLAIVEFVFTWNGAGYAFILSVATELQRRPGFRRGIGRLGSSQFGIII